MKSIAIRTIIVLAAMMVAVLTLAGTAGASHVEAQLAVPDEAVVGQPSEVQARLNFADDGKPVANTPVTFYLTSAFGGLEGEIELGQAVTDADGVAALEYEPRAAGDHQVRMEYMIGDEAEPESVLTTVSVAGASEQLHQSSAGVDIPGLNVWLLITLVAGVWAILLTVALRVIAIAHAGGSEGSA